MRRLSLAMVAAIAAAAIAEPEPCEACEAPENRGLCHSEHCRRQVLPQAKGPSWHRDAHSGKYMELRKDRLEDSADVRRAKRKDQSKRAAALSRQRNAAMRLTHAMHGGLSRARPRTTKARAHAA